ncbi:MAG: acyl-CoA dehydrogenase family protein [Chloroflexi bacterium]|nr:acyl-CoA dehydrogenase family protein [Chloroflexota bacterium]
MQFGLTDEQKSIAQTAREFVQRECAPHIVEWDANETYSVEVPKKLAALGMLGGTLPAKYGGAELDHVSLVLMIEGLATVCTITATIAGFVSCSLGQGTMLYGTEEQRQKYVAAAARGERFGATGLTEPHSGTDIVRKMETTATRDGDEYVIRGRKLWISNLPWADWFITFATLDRSLGHKGVCAFIVEKQWPGVSWQVIKNKMGARTFGTGELVLDEVRVPRENLVGKEYEGYKVLMAGGEMSRFACAARSIGQMETCLRESVRYAKERIVYEQPIGRYQLVQAKIADMAVGLETARLLTYKMAWLKDQGAQRMQRESSMAKLYATEVLQRSATDACQIFGAMAIAPESAVGRIYRDAKVQAIYDGTNDIHRVMIGEWELGYRS